MTVIDLLILIFGAGVAGLTLAHDLRHRSIPFRLQGHRICVSGEARRSALSRLGFGTYSGPPQPRLSNLTATLPVDTALFRTLTSLDVKDSIEDEKEFESNEIVGENVRAQVVDGLAVCERLLVGADGLRSRMREQLQPSRKPLDLERWIIWSRTPVMEDLKGKLSRDFLSWSVYLDEDADVQTVGSNGMSTVK
ncbi:hypothetical protein GGR53DRAFT_467504 [Hypoxylon sp. FL1150]|nr:hypothetical protein GGR53DRAFT_467504 [Hypoxylon sp. FL1150]